ncbi:hypothetical protein ASD50_19545 [Mesorhizobium sp. Root552]|uniref:acyltransferase family protein n=1 Tax=Mesorhizobium sp. Root552 TaxID=1736555 RepID=UPI0006F50EA4|nr:acyltransferase family protein [Mesorhizobium sp. Root552]KQZ28518.1 hypothetical protein ASD50_19545 [Mesorhizobium sp. Root552]
MKQDIANGGGVRASLRADIQALRGAAVLLVVLYHASLPGLAAGYLGVDLFFVISGFLITGLIRDGIDRGDFSFKSFYFRRAKRLLPAAYVVLALVVLCAPFILTDIELIDLREQVVGSLLFVANFVLWGQSGYFEGSAETKPLLHFWSLAIEEQYYFVMPLLLRYVPRKAWLGVVAAVVAASLVLSLYLASTYPDAAFYLPFTRMWELGIGSIGAIARSSLRRSHWLAATRLPAAVILFAVPFFPTGLSHPGFDSLLVCTATLMIILGHNASKWEAALPVRALARVGDISYPLYLVHWPLLVFTKAAYLEEPPTVAIWLAVAISVALSVVLYLLVEEPFRRARPAKPRRFVAGLVVCSAAIAITPPSITAFAASETDYAHIRRNNYGLAFGCAYKPDEEFRIKSKCRTNDHPKVLVWGDSYAMAWSSALMGPLAGVGMQQATMGACDPLYQTARFAKESGDRYNREYALRCMEFNDRVLSFAMSSPSIDIVVIAGRMQTPLSSSNLLLQRKADGSLEASEPSFEIVAGALAQLVTELHGAGKKVVFIAPPPANGADIGSCLERKARGKITLGRQANCYISLVENQKYRGDSLRIFSDAAKKSGIEVADVFSFLCSDGKCKTEINGVILYRDYSHLTYDGGALIGERSSLAKDVLTKAR